MIAMSSIAKANSASYVTISPPPLPGEASVRRCGTPSGPHGQWYFNIFRRVLQSLAEETEKSGLTFSDRVFFFKNLLIAKIRRISQN